MTLDKILEFAKYLLKKAVAENDVVIDATCGNGHDTVFLSHLVGMEGRVFAFDIQQEAINNSETRLKKAGIQNVELILDGHESVLQYVDCEISAAIFNLGYLPGSNKQITTKGATTWKAVTDMLSLLAVGGVIILVIYYGHESGKLERDQIEDAIKTLDPSQTEVLRYEFLNKKNAPYIIAIEKSRKAHTKRCKSVDVL